MRNQFIGPNALAAPVRKATLFVLIFLSFVTRAYGTECTNHAPDSGDRTYICPTADSINFCDRKIDSSCVRVNIADGVAALRNESFAGYQDTVFFKEQGVIETRELLSKLGNREMRTLAALLDLNKINEIEFSNHFVLKRSRGGGSFVPRRNTLVVPTVENDQIDLVWRRLASALETAFLLERNFPDYRFDTDICLNALADLSGQQIKEKILAKKAEVDRYWTTWGPVETVKFCIHTQHSGVIKHLDLNIY